ncbi:MAG: hypothetical protein WEB53_08775 [Akkermansiaceae bacterium]
MAREVKRLEVRAVDEELEKARTIVRLENEATQLKGKPVRLIVEGKETPVSQRLELPDRNIAELRTHQPGVDVLIEGDSGDLDFIEQNWGDASTAHRSLPWGWFVLIAMVLAGGVIWSLTRLKESGVGAEKIKMATEIAVITDDSDEKEAAALIQRIEETIRNFFKESNVDGMTRLVRHPDRVRPLMQAYYKGKPIINSQLVDIRLLQPVTLANRANFWMASSVLETGKKTNLLLEILESGEARIDWETLVCHQPMLWDTFAKTRPASTSLDFRVYVEADNFYSHEFADSNRWTSFRLAALDSDTPLFGYAPAGGEVVAVLQNLLQQNAGHRASLILRLSIPEGLQSRSGVVIEKVICPRWIYLESPVSDL